MADLDKGRIEFTDPTFTSTSELRRRAIQDPVGLAHLADSLRATNVALTKERDELKAQVVGLSADVTRLEGREVQIEQAADKRISDLLGEIAELRVKVSGLQQAEDPQGLQCVSCKAFYEPSLAAACACGAPIRIRVAPCWCVISDLVYAEFYVNAEREDV